MKFLFLLFGTALLMPELVTAQIKDSFYINDTAFYVNVPQNWETIRNKNEIQQDTSWNYTCELVDIEKNLYAQIGIQITENSKQTSSKSQQRKFRKSCTVLNTAVSRWGGYYLDYNLQKITKCKNCAPVKTVAYSFPLNPCYSLNMVFNGQGDTVDIRSLINTFNSWASAFISENSSALATFDIINFSEVLATDTFRVNTFMMSAIVPPGFVRTQSSGAYINNYTITTTTSCNRKIAIQVYAGTDAKDHQYDWGSLTFTSGDTLIALYTYEDKSLDRWKYALSTRRRINISSEVFAVTHISILLHEYDLVAIEYYKWILRKYADRFFLLNNNLIGSEKSPEWRPNSSPVKKIKFDKKIGN